MEKKSKIIPQNDESAYEGSSDDSEDSDYPIASDY